MALIPAFHETYGWCLVPERKVQLHPGEWSTYDPTEHNAPDVVAYLEGVGPRERERVLAAERAQPRPRKTVLAFADEHDIRLPLSGVDEAHDTTIPAAVGGGDSTSTGTTPATPAED